MSDKVQKIREEIEIVINRRLNLLNGDQFDLNKEVDGFTNEIMDIIDSLQEEPVSVWHNMDEVPIKGEVILVQTKDTFYGISVQKGGTTYKNRNKDRYVRWAYAIDLLNLSNVQRTTKEWKEPVSKELDEASAEYAATGEILANGKEMIDFQKQKAFMAGANWQKEKEYTCYEEAFEDGAKWKVENLWKPADGDDLPKIDREVIVLIKYYAQRNVHDKEYSTYRVGFGHRPNPNGWDGTNIDTGEKEHFEPEIYDKGGWNQPHVLYWLDTKLPYEEK